MGVKVESVWVLSTTEYEGQCTGFSSQTTTKAIFTKKPSMVDLATCVTGLPQEMGEAIKVVKTLLDTGEWDANPYRDWSLEEVPTNKKL